MIHLYCGDGKGKTTAACGLALRAAGSGLRVRFVQFFKSGRSAEVAALARLGVETTHPAVHYGRFRSLSEAQREEVRACYGALLAEVRERAADFDLIVLDEAVSAAGYEMIAMDALLSFLRAEGPRREIVLTGRNPAPALVEAADYVTEMRKVKHPFDRGVAARRGIEY